MKVLLVAGALSLALCSAASAVSLAQMISKCGDDGKRLCEGVGYGDPMQECLDAHFKELSEGCKLVMQKLRDGEKVTLL